MLPAFPPVAPPVPVPPLPADPPAPPAVVASGTVSSAQLAAPKATTVAAITPSGPAMRAPKALLADVVSRKKRTSSEPDGSRRLPRCEGVVVFESAHMLSSCSLAVNGNDRHVHRNRGRPLRLDSAVCDVGI
jgi:hypothetical protein